MASTRVPQRVLMSQADAAQFLGVGERTIRRYVATGRLTAYRVGQRLVRLDAAEVEALLAPIVTTGGAA